MRKPIALYLLAPEWHLRLYGPAEQAELDQTVTWAAPPQSPESIRRNPTILREVEILFAGWGTAVMDEPFLAAAPRLQAVFHAGGSIRYFVTDAFWSRGIRIASGAAINAIPVVEYTFGTILFSLRRGWFFARSAQHDGVFPASRDFPGGYGSVIGLISLGTIARQLCERLRALDVRIIAHDPCVTQQEADRLSVRLVGLDELFASADIVSLHAPLLPATTRLVTGRHFAAMKPGATFINTARGAIVDEPAMITALQQRPDLQAVLDVTDPEPPEPGSPLYHLPNVVLTPHIAGTHGREALRLGRAMVEEFHRWRRGDPLLHEISQSQFARMA